MNHRQQLIEQIRQQSIQARAQALREAVRTGTNMVPVAGAAGGGGGGTPATQYWIQTLFVPEGAESQIYLQSLTMDQLGNVYSLSNIDIVDPIRIVRKFANNGELTWQNADETISYQYDVETIGPVKVRVYQGHVYSLYATSMTKHTVSGDLVWQQAWNGDTGEGEVFNFSGFVIDQSGGIFINSGSSNSTTYLIKLSSETGQILKTVQLEIDGTSTYFNASPVLDSAGNIIVACNFNQGGYYSTITKVDAGLNSIISVLTLDEILFSGDGDVTATAIDQNDTLYVNQYGNSIFALDTVTGNVLWTKQIENAASAFHLTVSRDGVYWVGEEDWDDVGGPDGREIITIMKFSLTGDFEWATGIRYTPADDDFEVTGWSSGGTSGAQIVRDALLITAEVQLDGLDTETILKLPLTQVLGTYGDYEFFDITNELEFTSPPAVPVPYSATLSPATAPVLATFSVDAITLEQTKIINPI